MMVGLEELALRCVDDQARAHIREAVKCYEGGAYRAAITSAYVAVCFDLIAKLRALAAAGDAEAKTLSTKLDNLQTLQNSGDKSAIGGLLKFEKELLETFRDKFDFFGVHEFEELDRLRTDRNRCAHPTFLISSSAYNPPPELARLHIRNAVEIVLSQEAKQGKAALEGLRGIILSPYFPKTENDVKERLAGSELANARPSLINALIDDLAFGWPSKGGAYYRNIPAVHALIACIQMHPHIASHRAAKAMEKLLKSADKDHVHFGAVIAVRAPIVGEMASATAKIIINSWISNQETPSRANAVKHAVRISWLRPDALKIIDTLSSEEVSKATNPPDFIISRSATLFATAANWGEANKIASEHAVKFADRYSSEDIEKVVEAAVTKKADLQGSGGFDRFLAAIAKENEVGFAGLNSILLKHGLEPLEANPAADDAV
jgi:hypothetical protein